MQPQKFKDMSFLLKVAQDCYRHEPGHQINLEFWSQSSDFPEPWFIHDGFHQIDNVTLSTIPVLAAITLGYSAPELLKVIQNHGMTTSEFFSLTSKKDENCAQPRTATALSSWTIHTKIIDAISLDPQLTNDVIKEIKDNKVGSFTDLQEIDIARLLSNAESLWPITYINAYMSAKRDGVPEENNPVPSIQDLNAVAYCGPEFSRLSDDQIFMILERSGHLSMDLSPDNGFIDPSSTGFFKNLFRQAASDNTANIQRFLAAINGVDDSERLESLNSKLIQTLSDFDCKNWEGEATYAAIKETLDKALYTDVFDNPLIRLNLDLPPNTLGTGSDKGSLLALLEHLKGIEPTQYGQRHFKAIGKALNSLKACPKGVDLHDLLTITLRGLDAYTNGHERIPSLVTDSISHVANLIRFVTRNTKIDYERLQTLPSSSKALLVANGLDLKKLPGINRRDKGDLLCDQLGL
jgi:hypothetical protein